jgi:hypothetical protein
MKNQDKSIYNLDTVVSVKIVDKKKSPYFEFKPFKKSFFGNTKEGFYDTLGFSDEPMTRESIETGVYNKGANYIHNGAAYIIENNVVYYKPYVKVTLQSEEGFVRQFDTFDSALAYGNKISETIKNRVVKNGDKFQLSTSNED